MADEKPQLLPEPKIPEQKEIDESVNTFLELHQIGSVIPKNRKKKDPLLKKTRQKVLGALSLLAKNSSAERSPEAIATLCDIHISTVRYILPELHNLGFIEYDSGGMGFEAKVKKIDKHKIDVRIFELAQSGKVKTK